MYSILCALFIASQVASGHAVVPRADRSQPNLWSATSSTGLMVGGTWTATPAPGTGNVTGTWTLADPRGRTIARGVWSATKSPSGWTGAWRAAASAGRPGYSGTWTANTDVDTDAPFVDLFTHALQTAIGGTWRAGARSGAWSIRAFQ